MKLLCGPAMLDCRADRPSAGMKTIFRIRDARRLRRKLNEAIKGTPDGSSAEAMRNAVMPWRRRFAEQMFEKKPRLRSHEDRYLSQLIFGKAVNEEDIDPVLIPCVTREDFDVYDYFRMWSSFPTLDRPGRRLKFLLRDAGHPGAPLMGLCCLSSAVRQVQAREHWIGWSEPQWLRVRAHGLAFIMDLSTCVTVPPYSYLTAGKLLAAMMASDEIRDIYRARYRRQRSVFRRRIIKDFVLMTTTAGYGRNAPLYKGLSYNGSRLFEFIGYTSGYSSFQILPKLYEEVKIFTAARRGTGNRVLCGANARFRILRFAARELGIPEEKLIFSGHKRAVFVAPLAENWREYLLGSAATPRYYHYSISDIVQRWKTQWLSKRMSDSIVRDRVNYFVPESLRMTRLLDGPRREGNGAQNGDF